MVKHSHDESFGRLGRKPATTIGTRKGGRERSRKSRQRTYGPGKIKRRKDKVDAREMITRYLDGEDLSVI